MVRIILTSGGPADVADESISRIKGRGAVSSVTEIWGPSGAGAIETLEPAESLVARLQIGHPLAVLHVPNGEPVWIKATAVSMLRPASVFEHGRSAPYVNSVAIVAGRQLGLLEDFPTARAIIQGSGGLPSAMQQFNAVVPGLIEVAPDSFPKADQTPIVPWA